MRAARLAADLTLERLAAAAGCTASTIHRAEKAGRWPKQKRVREGLWAALAEAGVQVQP